MSIKDDVAEVQKAAGYGTGQNEAEKLSNSTEVAGRAAGYGVVSDGTMGEGNSKATTPYDAVNPPHYRRGPTIKVDIGSQITKGISTYEFVLDCISVMRHIKDPRLATALKYIWRVGFGGKKEPGDPRPQSEIDKRDIESAIWYLNDWLSYPT